MASLRRSALEVVSRSIAFRSRTLTQSSLKPAAPIASSIFASSGALPRAARAVSALGVEVSSMPLHSAIASARLKSKIGVEARSWSFLSQVNATTINLEMKNVGAPSRDWIVS